MKSYDKMFATVVVIIITIFVIANINLSKTTDTTNREYRVQVERAVNEIRDNGFASFDKSAYPLIISVYEVDLIDDKFLSGISNDYMLRQINQICYCFEYRQVSITNNLLMVNILLSVMAAVVLSVFIFIRIQIIKPFAKMADMPHELAKGNFTTGLLENKSRFFGKFVWGMNVLKDRLEDSKQAELELIKEKNMLILSISHDIKTPLSTIKLEAKALSKGLYEDTEKHKEIAEKINARADEIETFVTDIIKASNDDFLNFDVKDEEFYLAELIKRIEAYYREKLALNRIAFDIKDYQNILLKGDIDRAEEVIQNIIENAIKYGDGGIINIDFTFDEGCYLIKIFNSGKQLPFDEVIHIFESFKRGSNSTGISGNGLGLYICRKLMNIMGGEVFAEVVGSVGEEVSTEAIKNGMCFTVVFLIAE